MHIDKTMAIYIIHGGLLSHDLITFQRLIPSHWGLSFNTGIWGVANAQSVPEALGVIEQPWQHMNK